MGSGAVAFATAQFGSNIDKLAVRELRELNFHHPAAMIAVNVQAVIALGFELGELHLHECSNTPIRKMKGAANRIGRTRFINGIAETQKRAIGGVELAAGKQDAAHIYSDSTGLRTPREHRAGEFRDFFGTFGAAPGHLAPFRSIIGLPRLSEESLKRLILKG